MVRITGVLAILVSLYIALYFSNPNALDWSTIQDVGNRQGRLGITTLGVGVLIITGAIDLSIGSVIGLASVSFGYLIEKRHMNPYLAFAAVVWGGLIIGMIHGLLITQLQLQPFLVTLCGLFVYRGLTRLVWDNTVGLNSIKTGNPDAAAAIDQLRWIFIGKDARGELLFPAEFFWLLGMALIIGLLLHFSIYGRYCYAIGYNEQASRYAGIRTTRFRFAGFVICSGLAAFSGVLLLLDLGSVMPSNSGEGEELFAITGAVLGGCSLRGGEGTVVGMIFGAMVLKVLDPLIVFAEFPDAAQKAIVGLTLLFGTLADEFFRRRATRRG